MSKDGGTIAMRQEYAPLREFEVGKALGQSEHNHWGEAISMEREKTQDLASSHAGPTHAAPSQQMDAPVLSRG